MEASEEPRRGYRALRRGRVSIAHARYFLTFITKERRHGLASEPIYSKMQAVIKELSVETLALVVMPDHVHWLIQLDADASLSQAVRFFKGRMSPLLRKQALAWQSGAYHDRRLRPDDELLPFLRYMLCNPYRARLIEPADWWPYWLCAPREEAWLRTQTDNGRPPPEWLKMEDLPPWETSPPSVGEG